VDLAELCITSNAQIIETELDEISALATKAEGKKCSICWKINKDGCKRHPV
jgi:isoleucyl-tRNA synthetase